MAGVANAGMMMPMYQQCAQEVNSTMNSMPGTSSDLQQELIDNHHQSQCDESPVIDIVINNVVCSFSVRCHLNLKRIAMEGINVVYKRENGMVNMKIRKPSATASIWSSGKITCTGATSEDDARKAGRRFARILQNMGFPVRFCNFRVVNVLGTCTFPFGIRITHFSRDNPINASYEPELHPGVTYKIKDPKATLKIFSTGSITVTAPSVHNVQCAIEHIYPLVVQYQMEDSKDHGVAKLEPQMHLMPSRRNINRRQKRKRRQFSEKFDYDSDDSEYMSDTSEGDFDSDDSQK